MATVKKEEFTPVTETDDKVKADEVVVEEYTPDQPAAPEDDTRTYVGVPDGKGGWAHRVPTDEWEQYQKDNDL